MIEVVLARQDGDRTPVPNSTVDAMAARLRGQLIRPGEEGYEDGRRIWNGLIDRHPALVARCAAVQDVVEAVRFARENDALLAVRGGGHGVAGNAVCDDGLVVDLSAMTTVRVDRDARTASADGGCRLGELDRATQAFGLAAPLGVVSETGIAGLTLGGGMGWLRRRHGLTCDNLIAAEVVTADGDVVRASEDEHTDLLWGLRGGGGNFGVVTAFEYRLHPVGPEVFVAFVLYPVERAREALEFLRDYTSGAPEDVSPLAFVGRVPEAEPFPVASHGAPYVAFAAVHPGEVVEGERVLQPLRDLGDPIADLSGPMPYVEAQALLDEDYPDGGLYYWKSLELDGLGGDVIDAVIAHAGAAPSAHSTVDIWYQGGAMARVPADATAYGERPSILLGYEANFDDAATRDENVAWVRDSIAQLEPLSSGGAYLNFPGFFEEGEELLRASYGHANYERLVALKNAYDPTNLFRLNGNIRPSV